MAANRRITNVFSSRVISTFCILADASKFLVGVWVSDLLGKEQPGYSLMIYTYACINLLTWPLTLYLPKNLGGKNWRMLHAWFWSEMFSFFCLFHVIYMLTKSRNAFEQIDINIAHKVDVCSYFIFALILFEDIVCLFICLKIRSFEKAGKAQKKIAERVLEEKKIELIAIPSKTVAEPPKYEEVAEIV